MRKELPVAIACISGFTIVIAHFFDIALVKTFAGYLQDWGIVVAAFAILVSALNLMLVHIKRIAQPRGGDTWKAINSGVIIFLFVVTAIAGLISRNNQVFIWMFDRVMMPLGVTFVSMNMFYLVTAAYRAFRAQSIEATLLLGAGIIVLLGNAPVIETSFAWFADASSWIMKAPNMAAQRGLMIGAAIGAVQTGLRIICGIDRSYSGSGA
jgi:hypothetical protein